LWTALNGEAHLPVAESFESEEVSEAVEQFQQEIEATEALEKMDFATEYQPREALRNDGVMLAVGFKLTEDAKHLDVDCLEGMTVNINLTPELILAICNMLQLAAKEAGWALKAVIPAIVMDESSVSKVLH
jgi:predicted ATPase